MMKTAEEYAQQIGADWLEISESNGVVTVVSCRGLEIAEAQTRLDRLLNPVAVTPAQIRVWLILNVGPQVLDRINAMLDAIPDEVQRRIARVKWEEGITVLRDDPLLIEFAKALGFTESQMDQAFMEASQIV